MDPQPSPVKAQDAIAAVLAAVESVLVDPLAVAKMPAPTKWALEHAHQHLYEALWWLNAAGPGGSLWMP